MAINNKFINTYTTIITESHLTHAIALFESILQHSKLPFEFHSFFAEENLNIKTIEKLRTLHPFFIPILMDELNGMQFDQIYEKYYQKYRDEFRWSMKPVLINHLLEKNINRRVIYLDSDLYFFNNPDFLFDELGKYKVLLSPHWRCSLDPKLDWFNFVHNFKHGIYNGGFIGSTIEGRDIMRYWANLCLTACEKKLENGFHDDQKYLDIFHSYFEGVGVLRHKGCNVSNWNRVECKRMSDANGNVSINGEYPIIFIHFTEGTNTEIWKGHDVLLKPFFEAYAKHLKQIDSNIDLIMQTDAILASQNKVLPQIEEVKISKLKKLVKRLFNISIFI